MTEEWKEIPFNKNYEVSNIGNIRNSKTKIQRKFDIEKLKQTKTRIRVTIIENDNTKKGYYLHRLIAVTFIQNPNNLPEVNHKDSNPYNNNIANLEWISREDNMKHFHDNNKFKSKYMRPILLFDKNLNIIEKKYNCLEECIIDLKININYHKLYGILNNNTNKYRKSKSKTTKKHNNNYVGVSWSNKNNKFIVYHNNKYIGSFSDEIQGANCYDQHMRELYGTNAKVNFPLQNTNEKQALVTKNITYAENVENTEYKISENKVIKFEDNNVIEPTQEEQEDKEDEDEEQEDEDEDEEDPIEIEWIEVAEAPSYMISNTGFVKLKRLDRILKGHLINGYKSVTLKINGGQIQRLVHRLVAMAFIKNENEERIYVDHIDTNILNNTFTNLRWVTPKENMNNEQTKKNISDKKLKDSKTIYKISINTKKIVESYQNYKEIEEKGMKYNTILSICNYYKHLNSGKKIGQQTFKKEFIFLYEENVNKKDEYIENISEKNLNNNKIKIIQIEKSTNNKINEFESMYEASKKLNINGSAINQVCKYYEYSDKDRPLCYKLKSIKGFIFKQLNT